MNLELDNVLAMPRHALDSYGKKLGSKPLPQRIETIAALAEVDHNYTSDKETWTLMQGLTPGSSSGGGSPDQIVNALLELAVKPGEPANEVSYIQTLSPPQRSQLLRKVQTLIWHVAHPEVSAHSEANQYAAFLTEVAGDSKGQLREILLAQAWQKVEEHPEVDRTTIYKLAEVTGWLDQRSTPAIELACEFREDQVLNAGVLHALRHLVSGRDLDATVTPKMYSAQVISALNLCAPALAVTSDVDLALETANLVLQFEQQRLAAIQTEVGANDLIQTRAALRVADATAKHWQSSQLADQVGNVARWLVDNVQPSLTNGLLTALTHDDRTLPTAQTQGVRQ